jgi:uncharacterized protein YajQ (UPF0234 family)
MNDTTTPAVGTNDRLESLFDVLRSRERRRIVTTLLDTELEAGGSVPVRALVPAGVDAESFRVQLRHCHLPRLADGGYIEWDREAGRVRAGAAYDDLATVVELLREHDARLPGEWT